MLLAISGAGGIQGGGWDYFWTVSSRQSSLTYLANISVLTKPRHTPLRANLFPESSIRIDWEALNPTNLY